MDDLENLDGAHVAKQADQTGSSDLDWVRSLASQQATADQPAENPAYLEAKANFEAARPDIEAGRLSAYPTWEAAEAQLEQLRAAPDESTVAKVVRNLSPLEALGGALDYADNAFETARMISAKGDEALMGMGVPALTFGPDGVGTTTDYDEFAQTKNIGDALPDIGDPEKMGLARGAGRFIAGFKVAGRMLGGVQKLKTIAESGRIGASGVAALKGAISDFSGIPAMEENLANFIQEFPILENPVAEYLAADAETPEITDKLKTAILGAGFGMAVDGVMAGLQAVRAGRQISGGLSDADALAQKMIDQSDTQRGMISEALGDPDDARLLIEAGETVAGEGAEAGAKAAADGATNPRMNGGSKVGDVFVNWSRIDSEDEVKRVIQDLADRFSDSIDEARGGVKSFGQIADEAGKEDAWRLLTERAKGQPLNAQQTLAVRQIWTASGEKVHELAQRVSAGGGMADKIALKKMIAIHATIQEQVIGIRTETARALAQWRIPAGASDQFLSGMETLMEQMGTTHDIDAIATSITTLKSMGEESAADAFILGASSIDQLKKAGMHGADIIRQLFYGSLLSGPKTHARNAVSNTAMLAANAVDRKGASILGNLLGGQNVPDGEATELIYGTVKGIIDAFRISDAARAAAMAEGVTPHSPVANAILTGMQGMGVGKIEQPPMGALKAEAFGVDPKSNIGRVMDWIDTATRTPTRLLAAGDEIFRTANYQAQIHALSYRRAWQEFQSGMIEKTDIAARAAEFVNQPDEALRMLAMDYAEKSIFANRPPSDSKVFNAIRSISRVPVLGKLAMAFSKTPYNIFVETAQRTPLAFATSRFRNDIAAGGARADIAWTKFLVGNAALIALADVARKGFTTGDQRGLGQGDNSAGDFENKRLMGEQSSSAIFDAGEGEVRSVSYRGLEPFSTMLGMAANVVDILESDEFDEDDKELEEIVVAASAAIANQVAAPSFMSGLSNMLSFANSPLTEGQSFAERTASIIVPNAVAEVARWQDPVIRDVNGVLEAIKAKTPGLSQTLEASKDRWGRDRTKSSGFGKTYDAFVPFESRVVKIEPIDRELDRLEYGLAKPQKKQIFDQVPINMKLHQKEFSRFEQLAGNELTSTIEGDPITAISGTYESEGGGLLDELNAIIEGRHEFSDIYLDPEQTDGPDGSRVEMIRAIVNAYRHEAKRQLVLENPGLQAKIEARFEKMRAAGLVGEDEENEFVELWR